MVKGRDSEGSSIMFNQWLFNTNPSSSPFFIFLQIFQEEPFLKPEPECSRIVCRIFFKNICMSPRLCWRCQGRKVSESSHPREPSSTKRSQDFLSDIEYDETFDIPYELGRKGIFVEII